MYASVIVSVVVLSLSVTNVTGFNYQSVTTCPNVIGDSNFSNAPSYNGVTRGVYATNSLADAASDKCAIIKNGVFYVTGKDNSFTVVKYKQNNDLSSGSFTQVGPDGNTYRVIALKAYGPECGYMNLLLRCSDTVGSDYRYNTPQVKIHANIYETLSESCLSDAAAYATYVLDVPIRFQLLKNYNCQTFDTFCL